MNVFAYVRCSADDQNPARQLDALAPHGVPRGNLYIDKQSGKDFDRPAYRKLVKRLRRGDLLIVKSIDRLGRNYADVQAQWRHITGEVGADIKVLDMPLLDTAFAKDLLGTFIADIVLQLLSFCAENERSYIRARQAAGFSAAKAKGMKFGRPALEPPKDFPALLKRWERKELQLPEALKLCGGASESTFYRWRRELKAKQSHRKR